MSLEQSAVQAWRDIVASVPPGILTASDTFTVERAAGVLAGLRSLEDRMSVIAAGTPEYARLSGLWLRFAAELGLSPRARAALGAAATGKPSGGAFAALREETDL